MNHPLYLTRAEVHRWTSAASIQERSAYEHLLCFFHSRYKYTYPAHVTAATSLNDVALLTLRAVADIVQGL
jgi:hypothetical protein